MRPVYLLIAGLCLLGCSPEPPPPTAYTTPKHDRVTYVAKIAAAIGYDRLRGDVAVGNAKVGAPASIAGPWGDAGGALGFDGVDDGAILQPRDLPRNFKVPGGFTCTGLHWDEAEGAWWVVDFDAAAVYLVDPNNFTVLRTIAIGGGALLQGVVSNATDLYVADWNSDSIRVFNKTTGVENVGAAIALGWNPNGVTFNGSGNLLIIRAETLASENLYEYTTAGLLVGSKTIPASGYYSLDGCHWVDASTLYVCADRPSGAGNRDQILVVNPATGAITTRYAAPSAIEDVSVKGAEVFVTADDEFHASAAGGNRVSRVPLATHRDFGVSWFMKAGAVDGSEVIWSFGNPIDASGSDVNVERGIAAYLTTTSGQLRLILCDGTANALIHNFTGLSFAAWKHYAISIDAATQTMTLYVDGVQHGSAVDVSTLNLSYLWWKHRLSAGYTVDGVPSRFCDVDVARVAWFDETISAAEAVELAAGSEPTFTDPGAAALAGDVLHWGGSGGSTAADWDAEGQPITAYSAVVKQDGSPVGSPAQSLSGSLDLSAFGSGDYTVEQTATNAAGESVTAVTPAVAYSASVTPPTITSAPTLAKNGLTYSVNLPTTSGDPVDSWDYLWTLDGEGLSIDPTYSIDHEGGDLACTVIANNAGGSDSATTAAVTLTSYSAADQVPAKHLADSRARTPNGANYGEDWGHRKDLGTAAATGFDASLAPVERAGAGVASYAFPATSTKLQLGPSTTSAASFPFDLSAAIEVTSLPGADTYLLGVKERLNESGVRVLVTSTGAVKLVRVTSGGTQVQQGATTADGVVVAGQRQGWSLRCSASSWTVRVDGTDVISVTPDSLPTINNSRYEACDALGYVDSLRVYSTLQSDAHHDALAAGPGPPLTNHGPPVAVQAGLRYTGADAVWVRGVGKTLTRSVVLEKWDGAAWQAVPYTTADPARCALLPRADGAGLYRVGESVSDGVTTSGVAYSDPVNYVAPPAYAGPAPAAIERPINIYWDTTGWVGAPPERSKHRIQIVPSSLTEAAIHAAADAAAKGRYPLLENLEKTSPGSVVDAMMTLEAGSRGDTRQVFQSHLGDSLTRLGWARSRRGAALALSCYSRPESNGTSNLHVGDAVGMDRMRCKIEQTPELLNRLSMWCPDTYIPSEHSSTGNFAFITNNWVGRVEAFRQLAREYSIRLGLYLSPLVAVTHAELPAAWWDFQLRYCIDNGLLALPWANNTTGGGATPWSAASELCQVDQQHQATVELANGGRNQPPPHRRGFSTGFSTRLAA